MDRISISILDADLLNIETVLKDLKKNGVNRIHLDILDTSFVNNISFGTSIVNRILEYDFVFDLHLMVNEPIKILKQLILKKADIVTVHWESKGREEAISYLKESGCRIGIAINPDTPINEFPLESITMILIMAVFPGFGGQSFIKDTISKIEKLKGKVEIGVDGGINLETICHVKDCNLIVIGSAYFKSKDKKEFLEKAIKRI